MLQRKYLVPAVFTAALAGGGIAGGILGVPGVSFAQESPDSTTTVPEDTTTPEDTTVPEDTTTPEDTTVPEERTDENCPDKQGTETETETETEGSAQ